MKLDVVVPTYNRSHLLRVALESLLKAPVPAELDVTIIVADNNSSDDTAAVVQEIQARAPLPLHYVRETRQGSSNARNAGIAAGSGDIIGFIDDDEEIHPDWYTVAAREFANPEIHFIGGPCLGNWVSARPDWLPPGYHSAIGVIPPKPRALFNEHFSGILMGGNSVLRRSVFERVGLYAPHLGRSGNGLLSEEDAEFYRRVRAANILGMYVPDLAIYHYIDPERLTRRYHRRWVYWRAVSQGVLDRDLQEPLPYLLGVPRYRVGRALRNLLAIPKHALSKGSKGQVFSDELAAWDLFGFIYGKHFAHVGHLYASKTGK